MPRPTPADIAAAPAAPDSALWERRMKALTMRNAGATFPKIAEALGVSEAVARKDVRKAIAEVVKLPVDQMVDRQRAILLDITRVNYPAAMSGDRDAQAVLLRVLEHEAKLYGLYAPARVNVGISEQEFAAQAAELLSALGTEPLRELAGVPPTIDAEVIPPPSPEYHPPEAGPGEARPGGGNASIPEDTWSNL